MDAANHYKAVCRALVAEAVELSTFLDRIYDEREVSFFHAVSIRARNGMEQTGMPFRFVNCVGFIIPFQRAAFLPLNV